MAITFINAAKSPTSYPAGSNNTSTCTIAKPTNTANGDVMIALLQSGSGISQTEPAGWTLIGTHDNGSNMKSWAWYKVASGEGTDYTFTDDGGSAAPLHGCILTFRGCDTSGSPIDNYNTAATTTTDPVTTPSVTTTHTLCLMVHAAFARTTTTQQSIASQGTFTNAAGQTQRSDPANRGLSTEYSGEVSTTTAMTHVSPGSQSGVTFDFSQTPTNGIQWQIALKSTVPATSAPATVASATATAYAPSSLTVGTTSGFGAATAAAHNASVLTGVAAENTGYASATATAHDAMGWVIHPVDIGAIAFDATVAITTEATHAAATASLSQSNGYFGAPESRRWRIAAEDRSWAIEAESRVWTIPAED